MSDRRRVDQVLDPAFVDGLDAIHLDELRSRLTAARREEEELSYVRRLLHGRLDLMRAELAERSGSDGEDVAGTVGTGGAGGRGARARVDGSVAETGGRRRAEQIISEDTLARLHDMSPDELASTIGRVEEAEAEISSTRRALHGVLDALETELAERYKAGAAPPL